MMGLILWDALMIVLWLVGSVVIDAVLAIPIALDTIGPESTIEAIVETVFVVLWLGWAPVVMFFAVVVSQWNKGF